MRAIRLAHRPGQPSHLGRIALENQGWSIICLRLCRDAKGGRGETFREPKTDAGMELLHVFHTQSTLSFN